MKIAFFETNQKEKELFEGTFPGQCAFFDEPLEEGFIGDLSEISILSVKSRSVVSASILQRMPKLTYVTTRTTGFDHIDLEYCQKHNIPVSNVPAYGSHTVAEHAMALLLALSRNIVPSVERTRKHNFETKELQGIELFGKTVGVIGAGHIGQSFIRMAKGFGMDVIAYSVPEDEEVAKKLGFAYVDLETLFSSSDFISLHVPYMKATHHLIHVGNVQRIKKGCVLINTARGAVVETQALLDGLDGGIFRGLGLDVLEEEELMKDGDNNNPIVVLNNELLRRENVLITPHNGFNSSEAVQRIREETVVNIQNFLKGQPKNLV